MCYVYIFVLHRGWLHSYACSILATVWNLHSFVVICCTSCLIIGTVACALDLWFEILSDSFCPSVGFVVVWEDFWFVWSPHSTRGRSFVGMSTCPVLGSQHLTSVWSLFPAFTVYFLPFQPMQSLFSAYVPCRYGIHLYIGFRTGAKVGKFNDCKTANTLTTGQDIETCFMSTGRQTRSWHPKRFLCDAFRYEIGHYHKIKRFLGTQRSVF